MARPTVPIVLIGRFTTFAGTTDCVTLPVSVQQYDRAELTCWCGGMEAGVTFEATVQGSTDGVTWADLNTFLFTASSEHTVGLDLTRPLMRAVVSLSGGTFPVVTCYLTGVLIRRRV